MRSRYLCGITLVALLAIGNALHAEVRVPRFFSDNMVLQQKTRNAIWGWAEVNESISINTSWGAKAKASAKEDGRWKVFLSTPAHSSGHSLTIQGENRIHIQNVAIGEVWLCAGQSNMGWSTGNSFEAEKEKDVNLPGLRIFKSAREHWHEPREENLGRLSRWKPCTPESAAETSAVAYYFGKKLHQELNLPVGIIQRAYAGTPIEGWMPWGVQKDDSRTKSHRQSIIDFAERRSRNQGESVDKAIKAFHQELSEYNSKVDAGETMKNAFRPLAPPIITRPGTLGHQYPANIYNAMIHPIRPYGIRGMIWYQGERNSKDVPQAVHYQKQLTKLITHYRASWHKMSGGHVAKDFPFQFTQLPSWNPPQTKPVEGLEASWAANRESMLRVDRLASNTAMAVTIDTGDAIELHPKNKKPIGLRHAYLALKQTYGRKIPAKGPVFERQTIKGNQIVLKFSETGKGLMTGRQGDLNSFAISAQTRQWYWAKAKIKGDSVIVSATEVIKPVAVRYAWGMNPSQRNLLYNQEGFPASPFRTDDWPLFEPNTELVTVDKPEKEKGYESVDWKRPAMRP